MGAAARPGMGCKRCPLQRRVARQKKKLILERGCVLGFLEGEVQIDIVVSKKRPQGGSPTANPAQRVAVGKQEQSGLCSDVSLRYKIDTRYKRERKGKIKNEPGTRLASRLGLSKGTTFHTVRRKQKAGKHNMRCSFPLFFCPRIYILYFFTFEMHTPNL